ncbi:MULTISPECIES: potassium channel family protein [unclassified Thermococcus]|uniref:potassium channel family protein n=1 Tax=unclassified Thermococcus TaxID=2627626 RepID=UPI00143998F3|nr:MULTISPECIES: potassium channel family protein [unclassified Thermococcus]
MCEYVYENGEKCRIKPLQGSKYCSLHIPYEEGELLYGDKIKEIKEKAFLKRLKRGITYFEGVYLYDIRISNFKSDKTLVFKNSKIKTLIIDSSEIGGLTIYGSSIERVIIFETKLKTLMIAKSSVFGVNILRLNFYGSLYLKDSDIRYIMMNSFQYVKTEEKPSEEEYGERSKAYGRIELFNLNGVRRIGINSRYPLLRQILEEHGVKVNEVSRKHAKAEIFVISGVHFDENPRFKRQVRVLIRGFDGQLLMENLEIPGHVQITQSKIKLPEFVHVKILNNIIFRKVRFYSDITWNLTVLPNLVAELDVEGFILLEECHFNNPYIEEIFYRLARTSWEKNGDKDKADEYYYKEMVAKRKQRMMAYRKGRKKILLIEPYVEWLLADLTCKYGTTWKRPIVIWIITVNVVFPIIFYLTKSVEGSGVPLKSFLDYVYFSIVTATTLGYGDLHPIGIGRILASSEAIFGMFMWAVLLTVFARKYMR